MSTPLFIEATAEDRATWSAETYRKYLADWLLWEIDRGKDSVHRMVFDGRIDEARKMSGQVTGFNYVLMALGAPAPKAEPVPEVFTDPSAPPPRKWEKNK